MIWSARVHQSGDRIQLLKNGSVTKIIRASADTFVPAESQKFAKGLVDSLNARVAKQMVDPSAQPTVATKGEVHKEILKDVNENAKGISPKEASIIEENANLKKRIAQITKAASTERKARRGLAIVKTLVDQKKVANSEEVIKAEVVKIAAMSNEEISLLERKVAGKSLYDSVDDAGKASRRYARMARLHMAAAEDAQLAGDDVVADEEDLRAAHYDKLSKQAADEYAQFNNKSAPITSEDIGSQINDVAKGVDAQGKKASTEKVADDDIDDIDLDDEDDLIESTTDSLEEENFEDEDEGMDVKAAASIYRKIASNHKEAAEALKKAGKDIEAATELEISKEADELADSIDGEECDDSDNVDFSKEAAVIYRKIAADHRKKADEFEAAGQAEDADKEDEIADEADQMANSIEASDDAAPAAEPVVEPVPAEPIAEEPAVPAEKVSEEVVADDANGMSDIMKGADDEVTEAKTDDEDPLSALLGEDEKEASDDAAPVEEDMSMPTDDEINAAVSNDDYSEEDEGPVKESKVMKLGDDDVSDDDISDDEGTKCSSSEGSKKVANLGYSHDRNVDTIEQNRYANTAQALELEALWRKDEA
jgi:hypothetical protein